MVDQMSATYNVARNTKRWPKVVFFSILNMSAINARIIYIGNKNPAESRRKFIRQLADALVLEHLQRRSVMTRGMPLELQKRLEKFRPPNLQEDAPQTTDNHALKRKRCSICSANSKSRLTRYSCQKCRAPLCQHCQESCYTVNTSSIYQTKTKTQL